MPRVRQGGLAGKERKTHVRTRASRSHSQQLINDFFEPDPDTVRSQRDIPVRGRSEFLPSLTYHNGAGSARAPQQLELPLASTGKSTPSDGQAGVQPPAAERSTAEATPGTREPSTVPFPRQVLRRLESSKQTKPFTASGFLLGCALGSAAAAMILLVIRVTIG